MELSAKLKYLIHSLDIFSHPVSLRFNQQSSYQTKTGGLCSLMLIILFISIFSSNVLKTFHRQQISSSIFQSKDQNPSSYKLTQNQFIFALGVTNLDLNLGDKYFDVFLEERVYKNGVAKNKTKLNLVKCQKQQWQKLGSNFGKAYQQLHLNKWLCFPRNFSLQIYGKYTSQLFKHYKITVVNCSNLQSFDNRTCLNQTAIDNYINQYQSFNFNFYFSNTILNPDSYDPISTYLEDVNYFAFNTNTGISANIYISSYKISTQQSILPRITQSTPNIIEGGIILEQAERFNYNIKQNQYLKLYLRKSTTHLQIKRQFTKLDETISYIGGLFSALVISLFIIRKYSERSYEYQLAKQFFKLQTKQPPNNVQKNQFNFFTFIGETIYSLFLLINIDLQWKNMKSYHQIIQESKQQLDVRVIIRKLSLMEKFFKSILSKSEQYLIKCTNPIIIQQAKENRNSYLSYEKLKRYIQNKDQQKKISQNHLDYQSQIIKIFEGNYEQVITSGDRYKIINQIDPKLVAIHKDIQIEKQSQNKKCLQFIFCQQISNQQQSNSQAFTIQDL